MTYNYTIAPDDDHCCGGCANMEYEDVYGVGWCEVIKRETFFGDYCKKFKEEE